MPIIDIHPHIVSPDIKRYPLAPLGGTQSAWSTERPPTYEMLLQEMDAAGVDKAAIVHSSTAYGYDNRYVADAVQAVPARFTGVYSIDVLAPDAVTTFDHWLGRGCSGMRPFTTRSTLAGPAQWFAEPQTHSVWEHAAATNIPVCVQMKQAGIPLLRQIMDRFPKVRIILDHLSQTPFQDGPPYAGATDFLALAKYPQVHLKITPINVTPKGGWGKGAPETFFGKMIDTFGAGRIAWGSNFPNSIGTLKEILGAAQKALSFAKPSDQDWIFGRPALELYPRLRAYPPLQRQMRARARRGPCGMRHLASPADGPLGVLQCPRETAFL